MKKNINKIKEGILLGIGFILVLGLTGISYAVWTGLNAETGDSLTAAKWNELVNRNNSILANIPDQISCYTSGGDMWNYVLHAQSTNGSIYYVHAGYSSRYMLFNGDFSWNTETLGGTDCSGKSLTTIISEGKTNNFVNIK